MNLAGSVGYCGACIRLLVLIELIIDVVDFVLSKLKVNAAENINNINKACLVNNSVTVNLNSEV